MKQRVSRAGVVFVLVLTVMASTWGAARADGAWLDAPLNNWNTPGQDVPLAPKSPDELDPRCLERARAAETIEDAQVEKQGWQLVGMYHGGWGTRVVTGASQFDGMCRPIGYQMFVFQHGLFSGTISPMVMDSRTDGAAFNVILSSKAPSENQQLTASFTRYKAEDALCCASAKSDVVYRITVENGKPVLTPRQVITTQAPAAGN